MVSNLAESQGIELLCNQKLTMPLRLPTSLWTTISQLQRRSLV